MPGKVVLKKLAGRLATPVTLLMGGKTLWYDCKNSNSPRLCQHMTSPLPWLGLEKSKLMGELVVLRLVPMTSKKLVVHTLGPHYGLKG